ncbi:Indoleamine 23-dioxygenase protein [Rutstroemia sp. NJR-2017a BBW]|nr:Indoleamine 23-dioxygenase protein [Rutstroemia sp. NJR-2017a BBW]
MWAVQDLILARTHIVLLYTFPVALIGLFIKHYLKTIINSLRKQASYSTAYYTEVKTPIRALHPAEASLKNLIDVDGAGSWPPRTTYGQAWPEVLRPYHDIYLELVPSLSTEELSSDDKVNFQRCLDYRVRYRQLLAERIDMKQVAAVLSASENGAKDLLPGEAWNGLFACIALSRHAFRWGTIPIVKLAQEEQVVDIPEELNVPWEYLKRRYGVTSQGGNVTSNYLCNFDTKAQIVYPINPGKSDLIQLAEYHFGHVFPAMEELALPIYHLVTKAIHQHSVGDRSGLLQTLRQMNVEIRIPLKNYYETMVETKISRKVWMHYAQGFQGWAAGTIDPVTGEYTEYDGLSGNQLLFPQIIDAFLGLEKYLSDENTIRYIPKSQQRFREVIKEHNFRQKAKDAGDLEIEEEMNNIVKQMRVFRTAHRVRVKPYLSVPAPERLIMTAGKSVLESERVQGYEEAIAPLDKMLGDRLMATR